MALDPPFHPGDVLRHIPTGRPVRVAEVALDGFTVDTLDDVWADEQGKQRGGCRWECLWPVEGFEV